MVIGNPINPRQLAQTNQTTMWVNNNTSTIPQEVTGAWACVRERARINKQTSSPQIHVRLKSRLDACFLLHSMHPHMHYFLFLLSQRYLCSRYRRNRATKRERLHATLLFILLYYAEYDCGFSTMGVLIARYQKRMRLPWCNWKL